MRKLLFVFIASFSILSVIAQNRPFELGGEWMKTIGAGYDVSRVGLRAESYFTRNSFSAGLLMILPSKKSYSTSQGLGFYLGYRHAFTLNEKGNAFFAGARVLLSMEDFAGKSTDKSFFVTPQAEAGYHYMFNKNWFASPAVGYGKTFKLSQDYNSLDEDVDGRIIGGLSAGYRF